MSEDTAAVLAGLVERWRREADGYGDHTWSRGLMQQIKRECADELEVAHQQLAATGARALGSSDEVIERAARAAAAAGPGWPRDELSESGKDEQRDVARAVLAAAPPAPSAPGVAELLALCEERQKSAFVAVVSCDEIVRLLAPGGTDGT